MISVLIGMLLGFLSGLGIGGGSLLILWLTLFQNVDPYTARGINLLFFIPCAIVAAVFRWKQGSLPLKKILPAITAGSAAAFGFSLLGTRLDLIMLKRMFGILLILTGLRELFYKPKRKQEGH